MASCVAPQGFPVRNGCIDKVIPPVKRPFMPCPPFMPGMNGTRLRVVFVFELPSYNTFC